MEENEVKFSKEYLVNSETLEAGSALYSPLPIEALPILREPKAYLQ